MKQDFQFSVDRISVNTDLMKMCATQSKNGVMINFNLNIGNQLIGVFVKKDYICNPSTCDCEYDQGCKIAKIDG